MVVFFSLITGKRGVMEPWDTERYNLFNTSTFMLKTSSASALLHYSLHECPRDMPNETTIITIQDDVSCAVCEYAIQTIWSQTLIQLTPLVIVSG
jgi:hypothetical protein